MQLRGKALRGLGTLAFAPWNAALRPSVRKQVSPSGGKETTGELRR